MRSVAVTLTLTMVDSSSGEVSTKSVGNSWDTPTLLTIFVVVHIRTAEHRPKSALPSFCCKEREGRRDRRTEHTDFDRLKFLEKCFPSRVIRRRKVDNERLGLYASIVTATCVDYINQPFIHSITHCIYEEEKEGKNRTDIVYDGVELGLVSRGEEDIESSSSKLNRKLASDAVRCTCDD